MGLFDRLATVLGLRKRECNVLVVGLDNSGKSTVLNHFKPEEHKHSEIVPTVGFNVERFKSRTDPFFFAASMLCLCSTLLSFSSSAHFFGCRMVSPVAESCRIWHCAFSLSCAKKSFPESPVPHQEAPFCMTVILVLSLLSNLLFFPGSKIGKGKVC